MRRCAAKLIKKIKEGTVTEEDLLDFGTGVCKKAVEESLKTVPSVVNHVTKQMFFLQKLANDFYKKNPDLREYRKLVMDTIERVEGENPGMNYEEITKLAAERVRSLIQSTGGLVEKVKDKEPTGQAETVSRRRLDKVLEDL